MTFVYISERERWRSTMLLLWKRGPLQKDIGPLTGLPPIVKLICEYAAPPWPKQPLRKLTISLINTYTGINESYYAAKAKYNATHTSTQSNGNFVLGNRQNLILNNRYEVLAQIGSGAFGVVVDAVDKQTGEHVAIKIIKAKRAYSQQARREIGLLQDLRAKDVDGSSNVVELRGHFVYSNPGVGAHECLVFEKLNSNLYTLLESTGFNGFSLIVIRKFCEQLLRSLAFLARPGVRVIHTDIKPENICIRYPRRSAIKLIDFGSSCTEGHQLFSYIQSRYYRSPEVLLGYGYTVAIDMWSLACVLSEMHTGQPLFSGDNMIDQIRKIMAYNGLPPDKMIEKFKPDEKRDALFVRNVEVDNEVIVVEDNDKMEGSGKLPNPPNQPEATSNPMVKESNDQTSSKRRWLAKDPSAVSTKTLSKTLQHGKWKGEAGNTDADIAQFQDLLTKMTAYDPLDRITPSDALQHPFVTQDYPGSMRDLEQQVERNRMDSSGNTTRSSRGAAGVSQGTQVTSGGYEMTISQFTELSKVLTDIGIPISSIQIPLQWSSFVLLLKQFVTIDDNILKTAESSFNDIANERLRSRQLTESHVLASLLKASCVPLTSSKASQLAAATTVDDNQDNLSDTPIP
jgi:dual specificity tyrosine-phosphorylation-regulated kinase 1